MNTLAPLSPHALKNRLASGDITLVDIREADEFAREHIAGAVSVPLSRPEQAHLGLEPRGDVVFTCRTGMRTGANCDRLAARIDRPAFVLDGGLNAWKQAGLPVKTDAKAPMEIMRQVQITAGALVLAGVILAQTVHPALVGLSAFIGAGLVFAGASGWCGMAKLLAIAPWNRRSA